MLQAAALQAAAETQAADLAAARAAAAAAQKDAAAATASAARVAAAAVVEASVHSKAEGRLATKLKDALVAVPDFRTFSWDEAKLFHFYQFLEEKGCYPLE